MTLARPVAGEFVTPAQTKIAVAGGGVGAVECLQVKGGLYGAGEARQGEFVELADSLTDPGPVEPGEVSHVGPAVAGHRDREDVARVVLLKFHAQHP